jgi:hypothetical protein
MLIVTKREYKLLARFCNIFSMSSGMEHLFSIFYLIGEAVSPRIFGLLLEYDYFKLSG